MVDAPAETGQLVEGEAVLRVQGCRRQVESPCQEPVKIPVVLEVAEEISDVSDALVDERVRERVNRFLSL